jgi:hypothetical protein
MQRWQRRAHIWLWLSSTLIVTLTLWAMSHGEREVAPVPLTVEGN